MARCCAPSLPRPRTITASAPTKRRRRFISVYLGDQLESVFNDIKSGKLLEKAEGGMMDLGLTQILKFKRDPGDRNRTSPFAFTGNRFEFRAVGSSQSVSGPLVAMNTILAE